MTSRPRLVCCSEVANARSRWRARSRSAPASATSSCAHLPDLVARADQAEQIAVQAGGFLRGEPRPFAGDRLVPRGGDDGRERLPRVQQIGVVRLPVRGGRGGLRAHASPQVELPGDLADEPGLVSDLVTTHDAEAARDRHVWIQQRARLRDERDRHIDPRGRGVEVQVVPQPLVDQRFELRVAERAQPLGHDGTARAAGGFPVGWHRRRRRQNARQQGRLAPAAASPRSPPRRPATAEPENVTRVRRDTMVVNAG